MKFIRAAVCCAILTGSVFAQDVISAKSGLIHYFEGVITLDGKEVVKKNSEFTSMKEGSELRTGLGRAEVLLTPGVFLRVSENSAFRLTGNNLLDTRLALLSGSVLVEVGEMEKNQSLTMMVGEAKIDLSHTGLFRIDAEPAELKVHDGQAVVVAADQSVTVKSGKTTTLTGVIAPTKFNKDEDDAFYRWAARRSGYIASANLTSAKRVYDRGSSMSYSNWVYNPYFGMFTYLPMRGMYRSPFGYAYYSPSTISGFYYRPVYNSPQTHTGWMPPPIMDAGRGMSDMGGRGGYSSGTAMAAPPMSSAPAAPAAAGRGAGGGASGGRGAGGGR